MLRTGRRVESSHAVCAAVTGVGNTMSTGAPIRASRYFLQQGIRKCEPRHSRQVNLAVSTSTTVQSPLASAAV